MASEPKTPPPCSTVLTSPSAQQRRSAALHNRHHSSWSSQCILTEHMSQGINPTIMGKLIAQAPFGSHASDNASAIRDFCPGATETSSASGCDRCRRSTAHPLQHPRAQARNDVPTRPPKGMHETSTCIQNSTVMLKTKPTSQNSTGRSAGPTPDPKYVCWMRSEPSSKAKMAGLQLSFHLAPGPPSMQHGVNHQN